MPDFYDQNEPVEPVEAPPAQPVTDADLGISVYSVAGEKRRLSRTTKMTVGGASAAVLLLAVGLGIAGGDDSASAGRPSPSTSTAPSASTSPTWTPSAAPTTVEPFIPTALVMWMSYLDADERAEICAESGTAARVTAFNEKAYENVRDVTSHNQYTSVQVTAAMKCPKPKPVTFDTLNARDMTKVINHPDSHIGESYTVYGMIIQYDPVTGSDSALALVSHRNDKNVNSLLDSKQVANLLGESDLEDLIEDDFFRATVTVTGSHQYTTTEDEQSIVPEFTITSITQTGHWDH